MILTNTKIQTAIIKAWYSIALKSIKYYGGLAIGINNSCLLKQVRLLRAYVDILKCFKIVGSTPTCNCHIEGDYTVELVDGVEITSSPIQFGCNNEGYLVYNGTGYPFTYYYDSNNNLIQINFTTIEESITLEDVQFTDNCNITNGQTTQSPIEMTEFEVTGTPVIAEGYDGSLVIVNGSLDVIYTLVIPYNILNDPEAIVNLWNNTYGNTGFLLSYNGSNYIFTSPLDGNNYFGWGAQFNQYEGGVDSFTTFINPLTQPFVNTFTPATTIQNYPINIFESAPVLENPATTTQTYLTTLFNNPFSTPGLDLIIEITDGVTPIEILNLPDVVNEFDTMVGFVNYFNQNNTLGFTATIISTNGNTVIEYTAPSGSGSLYNTYDLNFLYTTIPFPTTVTSVFSGGNDSIPNDLTITIFDGTTTSNVLVVNNTENYFTTINEFIDYFNQNNLLGITVAIDSISGPDVNLIYTAPQGSGTNYNNVELTFNWSQDPFPTLSIFTGGIDTTSGTLYWGLVTQLGNFVVYQDNTPFNYTSLQEIVDAFNNGNNQGFTATLQGSDIIITSPQNSFDFFNGDEVELAYTYESEEYEDYNTLEQFSGGEQPEIVTYEEFFAPIATIGDFVNDNPCEPETVEQYCLSNKNIISIIKHIDRIVS